MKNKEQLEAIAREIIEQYNANPDVEDYIADQERICGLIAAQLTRIQDEARASVLPSEDMFCKYLLELSDAADGYLYCGDTDRVFDSLLHFPKIYAWLSANIKTTPQEIELPSFRQFEDFYQWGMEDEARIPRQIYNWFCEKMKPATINPAINSTINSPQMPNESVMNVAAKSLPCRGSPCGDTEGGFYQCDVHWGAYHLIAQLRTAHEGEM